MEQPVPSFIIGSGRCGSTALYRELSAHPDVSWLSSVMERAPDRPALNHLAVRAGGLPGTRRLVYRFGRPSEAYRWWDSSTPGFRGTRRDLVAGDVTPTVAARIRERTKALQPAAPGRLLFKITGWPRVGFLGEVFPGARFVHVVRDGRAVAASLLHVDWWDGWLGPSSWRFGPLTPDQERRWAATGFSYAALAGLNWEILVDATAEAMESVVVDQRLTVRYEDLCADPCAEMRRIAAFLDLSWDGSFARTDWAARFRPSDAWRQRLTPPQLAELETCIEGALARHGYG